MARRSVAKKAVAKKSTAKRPSAKTAASRKAAATGANVEVVVTVEDAHRETIAAVARRLKAAGLCASQTLKSAGIVTGSVAHGSLTGLKGVAGVKAVEASGGVQIAPPDAEVQ